MILGFTGTQRGMTPPQRETLAWLFEHLRLHELHHGDCIGADAQAHGLAFALKKRWSVRIVGHPPTSGTKRAYCPDLDFEHEPADYLIRNLAIVQAGVDGLVACPKDFHEPRSLRGQGTWTTIGYARRKVKNRPRWIIFPDGSHTIETT
jgi:hypothetical protein